jgi:hypothetical protein
MIKSPVLIVSSNTLKAQLGRSLDSSLTSSNDSVIFAVMTNPKPNNLRTVLDSDGTIMNAYTD